MSSYPNMASRMYTPAHVLKCEYVSNKGQNRKQYKENEETVFIAFSNFQGTENVTDGVITTIETATICAPFIPDLTNSDRIKLLDDNSEWEIINAPENWNMQNTHLVFKVQRYKSGV